MTAAATAAIVAVLLLGGSAAILAAVRARTQLRLERLAARLAREREAAFVDGVRRLGLAALRSPAEVRSEIDAAVRRLAPGVDSVLLFDESELELVCTFASGTRVAYFDGTRIARTDESLPAKALRAGHRVTLDDGVRSFHPADAFALAVPLPRNDGRSSVLYVAAPVRVADTEREAIVTLADHAAFTYALAQERDADRRRAEFDGLTGLVSPRAFRDRLNALLERAKFAPLARIALLFVDTDRFKQWNDTCGHASGDALLKAIANTLRNAVGGDEIAARNGGDEFCVVLVDTEKSAAIARADALRGAIAGIDFAPLRPAGVGDETFVTASIGVAAYPIDAENAQDLLEKADAAMYYTKDTGRDGVCYYGVNGTLARAGAPAVATP